MHTKKPINPLPPTYMPAGGQPYHVADGDSWQSIAKKRGVNLWWLIQYNFETRDPGEVNWYLENRVGCVKKTFDGKNFMFSSSAKPGIVYLPPPSAPGTFKNLSYKPYGIVIEGDEDYQREVTMTLGWIARSDTGMILLNGIKHTGKQITINPWDDTSQCNAMANPTDDEDSTASGYPVLTDGAGGFEQMKNPSWLRRQLDLPEDRVFGSGKGSNVLVYFSPSMWGYGVTGACVAMSALPGASPSQILFHELCHAYREARGVFNRRPTIAGSVGYTNMEEFFAVVLSNVLTSDPTYSTGNRTLRMDHAGFNPLMPSLSTSKGFAGFVPNRNKLRELVASEPQLTTDLKTVKSYFNPFTEPL